MSHDPNPYAPPRDATPPVLRPSNSARAVAWAEPFRSARTRAWLAIGASAGGILADLLLAGALLSQIWLLTRVLGGETITQHEGTLNDTIVNSLSLVAVALTILAMVLLLVWIYAAQRNLPALGTRDPEFTPGWAVGWWFIPIMNLFKPCQAMLELARGSDPAELHGRASTLTSSLVVAWWLSRIISAIASQVLFRYDVVEESIPDLINYSWFALLVVTLCDVPMALLQIVVIWRIDWNQEARIKLVAQPTVAGELAAASSASLGQTFGDDT